MSKSVIKPTGELSVSFQIHSNLSHPDPEQRKLINAHLYYYETPTGKSVNETLTFHGDKDFIKNYNKRKNEF